MVELFDLKKHRFGMAYNIPYHDGPVYIYDLSRSGASGYGIPVNSTIGRCKPVLAVNLEAATRAPEHDMVKNIPVLGAEREDDVSNSSLPNRNCKCSDRSQKKEQ